MPTVLFLLFMTAGRVICFSGSNLSGSDLIWRWETRYPKRSRTSTKRMCFVSLKVIPYFIAISFRSCDHARLLNFHHSDIVYVCKVSLQFLVWNNFVHHSFKARNHVGKNEGHPFKLVKVSSRIKCSKVLLIPSQGDLVISTFRVNCAKIPVLVYVFTLVSILFWGYASKCVWKMFGFMVWL